MLSKDDPLYAEWTEGVSDEDDPVAACFADGTAGAAFAREWLGRLRDVSPYLVRSMFAEKAFVADIARQGYDKAFSGLMKGAFSRLYAKEVDDFDVLGRELRLLKRRAALVIALADISGQWNLARVTHALSVLAEACLRIAVAAVLLDYHQKGELSLPDAAHPERDSGFFLIAMGKLGARELNYSSDIDLIVLFDGEKAPYTGKKDIGAFFVRMAKKIIALIDDKNEYGYVFRTDLRLRPDPGSTPVALSTQAACYYYESFAQNWERAAFIKARVVAGDKVCGNGFLKDIRPFVWRRTTDFYALRQIGDIKRSLGARSTETPDKAGFNIKLGQGGIREIEFFTQLQQLLWGGRDAGLRAKGTLPALNALTKAGWVSPEYNRDLTAAYVFLRTLEHRLQMVEDQQTQTLPKTEEALASIARFAGFADTQSFLNVLSAHCRTVRRIYDTLFAEESHEQDSPLLFGGAELSPQTVEALRQNGFNNIDHIGETVRGWLSGRYRALRSDRARELMADLLPPIFTALGKSPDADAAFDVFDEFLQELPAGVQLFALFQSRPALLDLLAELISTVPVMARELTHHVELFDAVLSPSFFAPFPSASELQAEAAALPELAEDDELATDAVRRFVREKRFRCAVLFLRGLIDKDDVGRHLADLVTAALNVLCPVVLCTFEKRYGTFENASFSFVLLGKAGSGEMTFKSDLDIMFVYNTAGQGESAGGVSSLSAGSYYARLAQRVVNALTANTREGQLWAVDMRLRPSGNAGPVAVSMESFKQYYAQSAWTWELMALTKARVVWGEKDNMTRVLTEQLCRARDVAAVQRDVADMRDKVAKQMKILTVAEQIKYGAGGMVDIEFFAQFLQLAYASRYPELLRRRVVDVLEKAVEFALISAEQAQTLIKAYRLWTLISALLSLNAEQPRQWADLTPTTQRLICDFCGVDSRNALEQLITETAVQVGSYRLFGNGDGAL